MWKWLQHIGLFGTDRGSSAEAPAPPSGAQRQNGASSLSVDTETGRPKNSDARSESSEGRPLEEWTNEQWVAAFRCRDFSAIRTLRKRLASGLVAALRRAASKRRIPQRTEALAEEAARKATGLILDDPEAFWEESVFYDANKEGESGERKFTTWAQKIAVHVAFSKLRRGK